MKCRRNHLAPGSAWARWGSLQRSQRPRPLSWTSRKETDGRERGRLIVPGTQLENFHLMAYSLKNPTASLIKERIRIQSSIGILPLMPRLHMI